MEFKFILGVDMSKEWHNYCLMDSNFKIIKEGQINNTPDANFIFINQLVEEEQIEQLTDIILVLEHTGIYVQHLVRAWLSKGGRLSLVSAPKVSDQLGGKRTWDEKTDTMDARRLAEYGVRYTDKLKLWQAKRHILTQLQNFQIRLQRFYTFLLVDSQALTNLYTIKLLTFIYRYFQYMEDIY